jgi:hypothetical protein
LRQNPGCWTGGRGSVNRSAGATRRQRAEKPVGSYVTIPADIHNAVMELSSEERLDRVKVNAALRRYAEIQNPLMENR